MALMILRIISGCYADRGIDPLIRVRKNASFKGGGCMPRKFAVVLQLGNPVGDARGVMATDGWWSQRSQALNVFSESIFAQLSGLT